MSLAETFCAELSFMEAKMSPHVCAECQQEVNYFWLVYKSFCVWESDRGEILNVSGFKNWNWQFALRYAHRERCMQQISQCFDGAIRWPWWVTNTFLFRPGVPKSYRGGAVESDGQQSQWPEESDFGEFAWTRTVLSFTVLFYWLTAFSWRLNCRFRT